MVRAAAHPAAAEAAAEEVAGQEAEAAQAVEEDREVVVGPAAAAVRGDRAVDRVVVPAAEVREEAAEAAEVGAEAVVAEGTACCAARSCAWLTVTSCRLKT